MILDEEKRIRRMAEGEILQRVSDLNQKYEVNDFNGDVVGEQNYQIVPGRIPVVISAPHTVRQWREGKMKERDGMTGGLAEYLCERFGVWGVIRTWNAQDDPNHNNDERSKAYRATVAEVVRAQNAQWMFDLHGCLNKHGFDMSVRINGGGNLNCEREELDEILKDWRDVGLDVRVDEQFFAAKSEAVSNYIHRVTGINCLQLEISTRIRTTEDGLERFCDGFGRILAKIMLAQK